MKKFFTFILIVFVIGYLATQVISFINSRYAVPEYLDEYTQRIEKFSEEHDAKKNFEKIKELMDELNEKQQDQPDENKQQQQEEPTVNVEDNTAVNNNESNSGDTNGDLSSAVSPVYFNYHLLLDDAQKELYLLLLDNVRQGKWTTTTTLAPHLNLTEALKVADSVVADHPELFWISYYATVQKSGNETIVTYIPYAYWNMTIDTSIYTAPFMKRVEELTDIILLKQSDDERISYIHDYLVRTVTYDHPSMDESGEYMLYNPNSRYAFTGSAYGALMNGSAICAGYAKGFQIVLQNAGYTAGYLTGYVGDGAHAWNRVFNNNQILYYDTTFDDLGDFYAYPNDLSYDYYGLTKNEIEKTHVPNAYCN